MTAISEEILELALDHDIVFGDIARDAVPAIKLRGESIAIEGLSILLFWQANFLALNRLEVILAFLTYPGQPILDPPLGIAVLLNEAHLFAGLAVSEAVHPSPGDDDVEHLRIRHLAGIIWASIGELGILHMAPQAAGMDQEILRRSLLRSLAVQLEDGRILQPFAYPLQA